VRFQPAIPAYTGQEIVPRNQQTPQALAAYHKAEALEVVADKSRRRISRGNSSCLDGVRALTHIANSTEEVAA
jgi:hypothetical protein